MSIRVFGSKHMRIEIYSGARDTSTGQNRDESLIKEEGKNSKKRVFMSGRLYSV